MFFLDLLFTIAYMVFVQPHLYNAQNTAGLASPPEATLCSDVPVNIVFIGIDGFTPQGLMQANTPVLDKLMQSGAYTLTAQPVLPTLSSPNWTTLLTGVLPNVHQITSNEWAAYTAPSNKLSNNLPVPSIFELIRRQLPQAITACFYQWQPLGNMIAHAAPTVITHTGSEALTTNRAIRYFKKHKPAFTFIHFDHVDHAGHFFGYNTYMYKSAVERADELIGRLVKAVERAGMKERTVFIVTTDHGGLGHNHGGDTPDECNIPFIISGAGIKQGHPIAAAMNIYDVAPTIAQLLGLQAPKYWVGKPINEVFEGVNRGVVLTP